MRKYKNANTQMQIHKYTNTAFDKVPERPNMWYFFEKRSVAAPQCYKCIWDGIWHLFVHMSSHWLDIEFWDNFDNLIFFDSFDNSDSFWTFWQFLTIWQHWQLLEKTLAIDYCWKSKSKNRQFLRPASPLRQSQKKTNDDISSTKGARGCSHIMSALRGAGGVSQKMTNGGRVRNLSNNGV